MKCEGWTRYGGAFTLGFPEWRQCENDAVVMISGTQSKCDGTSKKEKFNMPACMDCWIKAESTNHMMIKKVLPIKEVTNEHD